MPKLPTRFKAEVLDRHDRVAWEVLVHDLPSAALRSALFSAGYRVQRATYPDQSPDLPMTFSAADPVNSVLAALEHHDRRPTQLSSVLRLLIDRSPEWIGRGEVRKAGGDQGDRRVRELRQRNWPIETRQLDSREAWHVRLVLPERHDGRLF